MHLPVLKILCSFFLMESEIRSLSIQHLLGSSTNFLYELDLVFISLGSRTRLSRIDTQDSFIEVEYERSIKSPAFCTWRSDSDVDSLKQTSLVYPAVQAPECLEGHP